MNTFIYKEDGITEYISLDKATIERVNNKRYLEDLLKNMPTESLKKLFTLLVQEQHEIAFVHIGNVIEYQTDLGKQKFLHIFVNSKDYWDEIITFNFLLSNYELLQYDEVNARDASVVLTDKKDCLFSNHEVFQIISLLFSNQNGYKKDWTTYQLAKETYLKKKQNENLRKDILEFKESSLAQISLGESVVSKLDEQQPEI